MLLSLCGSPGYYRSLPSCVEVLSAQCISTLACAALFCLVLPSSSGKVWCVSLFKCYTLQAAHSIFATMTSQGIKPSLHTFHSLLKDTSQLKAAGLRDLYSQMLSTKGLVLTEVSFHYVFRAANQCRGWPASWLFQVEP